MDPTATHDLLHEVDDVRQRARGDRRATSVPLLVFGGLTIVDALLRAASDPFRNLALVLLAPVGFALVALYYRRREIGTGVGRRSRPYAIAALVTLAAVPFMVLLGAPVLVGIGLLVIAVQQRNRYLGIWAVVYGVVGSLEALYVFSNRLYEANEALGLNSGTSGYFSWSSSLVFGALGVVLVGAGLYARRKEVASG